MNNIKLINLLNKYLNAVVTETPQNAFDNMIKLLKIIPRFIKDPTQYDRTKPMMLSDVEIGDWERLIKFWLGQHFLSSRVGWVDTLGLIEELLLFGEERQLINELIIKELPHWLEQISSPNERQFEAFTLLTALKEHADTDEYSDYSEGFLEITKIYRGKIFGCFDDNYEIGPIAVTPEVTSLLEVSDILYLGLGETNRDSQIIFTNPLELH